MTTDLASVQVVVHGHVQGVYFRAFTSRQASKLGLTGYVRNLPDWKMVEVLAEGERNKLEELIDSLKVGPPGARVEKVDTSWLEYSGGYTDFSIRH